MAWKKYLLTSGITVGWLWEHYRMRAPLACHFLCTPTNTLALTLWNPAKLSLWRWQIISTPPGLSWFSGETGKTSVLLEITLKNALIHFFQVLKSATQICWSFYLLSRWAQLSNIQPYGAKRYSMYSSVTSGIGLTEERTDQEEEIVALTLSSSEMFSNPLKS